MNGLLGIRYMMATSNNVPLPHLRNLLTYYTHLQEKGNEMKAILLLEEENEMKFDAHIAPLFYFSGGPSSLLPWERKK